MNRLNLKNRTYFITSVTQERRKLFSVPELARIVIKEWEYYEEHYNFDLHAYTVMPDHYHVLIELNGDKGVSKILYAVHSYSAKLINDRLGLDWQNKIWEGNSFDEVIRSENMYYQKLAYILFNPWRSGLVEDPFDRYEFSNLEKWICENGEEFVQDLFSKYKLWLE